MKWYVYIIVGILVIAALILPGCGSSQNDNNQSNTNTQTTTSSYEGQVIVITYSTSTIDEYGMGLSSTPPKEGYVFLLVNLHIENHGYSTFSVSNFFFTIKVNGKQYTNTSMTGANDELVGGTLHDNESTGGNLAFEVPEDTTDFEIFYKYASSFNIQWTKL